MAKKVEKRVPDIRFKGFTDDWEQRKFGSIFNKSNEKNDLNYGKGQVISVANMTWSSAPEKSTKKYMKTYNVAHFGDIVFEGHKNKMYQFGRFVENTIGDGIVSHIFDVYRPQDLMDHDLDFWKYYINSERVMRNTLRMSTTSARMMHNLVAKDLAKQLIKVPHFEESKRIGKILHDIERATDLQQKKLEQMKLLKKAMLQQLFPDKDGKLQSRFNGFTNAWEQRKLGNITKTNSFKPYISKAFDEGKYEVIQQGDNPIAGYANNEPFEDYKSVTLFGDHTLSLYKPQRAFLVASDGIKILSPSLKMDGLFYYYLLEKYKPHSEGYKRHFSILKKNVAYFPINIAEQIKINHCLSNFDTLVALHQRKLDQLKLLKKFLLQKMFI